MMIGSAFSSLWPRVARARDEETQLSASGLADPNRHTHTGQSRGWPAPSGRLCARKAAQFRAAAPIDAAARRPVYKLIAIANCGINH